MKDDRFVFDMDECKLLLKSLDVLEDKINNLIDEYEVILTHPISVIDDEESTESNTEEQIGMVVENAKIQKDKQEVLKEYVTLLKAKIIRLKDTKGIHGLFEEGE